VLLIYLWSGVLTFGAVALAVTDDTAVVLGGIAFGLLDRPRSDDAGLVRAGTPDASVGSQVDGKHGYRLVRRMW
jgi:hypothetical protein